MSYYDHSGSYKTVLGATLSLIIYGLLIGAVYNKGDRVLNYQQPLIVTYSDYFDVGLWTGKTYKDLKYVPFIRLSPSYSQKEKQRPL